MGMSSGVSVLEFNTRSITRAEQQRHAARASDVHPALLFTRERLLLVLDLGEREHQAKEDRRVRLLL